VLFLLVYYQSISVFKGIFRAPFKVASDLRPFLETLVVLNKFKQLNVFIKLPGSLLEVRTKVAGPVLPALLGVSIYFILVLI
jgi:hypothetical protein